MSDIELIYDPELEINRAHAETYPNNCSVRERTADGVFVGVCWFHLEDGTTCQRHGVVKIPLTKNKNSS